MDNFSSSNYFFLILFSLFNTFVYSQDDKNEKEYAVKWKKIEMYESKGLPRKALEVTDSIFEDALKEDNHNQLIKAVLFKLKYNSYLEEDDYVLGINQLNQLIEKAKSPAKEILHSITAEVYWGYYSSNSWKFQDRTTVGSEQLADIRTWDLTRIASKVKQHYFLSLQNEKLSKSLKIQDFDIIIDNHNYHPEIRPTLYDFLAHRALDFAMSTDFNVPGPAESFAFDNPVYFDNNIPFLKSNDHTKDSLNTRFFALKIFHSLTQFHLNDKNIAALFNVQIERLKFAYAHSSLPNSDELYLEGLKRMTKGYYGYDEVAEAWFSIAEYLSIKGNKYNAIGDTTNRWELKNAHDICTDIIQRYPKSFGAQQCQSLLNSIESKFINCIAEKAIPTNQLSKFLLTYKNVEKLYYKIVAFNPQDLSDVKYNNTEKLLAKLNREIPSLSREIDLKRFGDFQQHSLELEIPPLDGGFYYILLGSDPSFNQDKNAISYFSFWVTDLTYQVRKIKDYTELIVRDRVSGKPVVDAEVMIYKKAYNYKSHNYERTKLKKVLTDIDGKIGFANLDESKNYNFVIKKNGDWYDSDENYYDYKYYPQNETHFSTHFYTDRKLYRPGQTIHFKGICVQYKGKERTIVKNQETQVVLYDANGQEITKQLLRSNKFGSFEGSFIAPQDVLTGLMTIRDKNGATTFRVEEYKRPKFNVVIDEVTEEYQVNDSVEITGIAEAFAGNRIDGAQVSYRIVRSTQLKRRYWWEWYPTISPKEVAHGNTVTNNEGEFQIHFKSIPDLSINPNELPVFNYTVYVDITDLNGETRSGSSSFVVGYQSLKLGHNLTTMISNQKDFQLEISTKNLNGQNIPAQGKMMIEKLVVPTDVYYDRLWIKPDVVDIEKHDFKKKYPNEAYSDEDKYQNLEIEKTIFESRFNTADTNLFTLPDFLKWEPGMYRFIAKAKDKNGVEVDEYYYFSVFNPKAKTIPLNVPFWVHNLKAQIEPGNNAEILIGTADKEVTILYEIEANDKIIKKEWIKLSKEQRKISFPILEAYRGNISVHFSMVKNNRVFNESITLEVPYTNKELDLSFSTFRNKLLPGQDEEWTLTIKNKNGSSEQAELLATLYDASLDDLFTPNAFFLDIYSNYYGKYGWGNPKGMGTVNSQNLNYNWNTYVSPPYRTFAHLNYFGWSPSYYNYYHSRSFAFAESDSMVMEEYEDDGKGAKLVSKESANEPALDAVISDDEALDKRSAGSAVKKDESSNASVDLSSVKARTNFNETAFFYPQLTADKDGTVKIKFTIPESLTKWRFLGLAHTEDLKIGTISDEVITQKELMVVPNIPRFLRVGDEMILSSKITNLSDSDMNGVVQLSLFDVFSNESLDKTFDLNPVQLQFSAKKGQSTSVFWKIKIPENIDAVKYKIVAKAGSFSDGEENVLPILSNRMLVTESLPLPIRGKETKSFKFQKLIDAHKSNTLKNHRYTLEFSSNPAWYAIQAMPYMMEYPHECAEQTFTRYYSNAIASHIMNSSPKIQKIIHDWGDNSPDAFLSNLQKNQELKAVILEETPWVLDAKDEEQSKKNLSILLDMERMSAEQDKALTKVIQSQSSNGGWPWFPGMRENRFITQHIVTGMGHLDHLGIKAIRADNKIWSVIKKAVLYLDAEIVVDFKNAKKWDKDYVKNQHIGYSQIQYLYARSYFGDIGMNSNTKEAVVYYQNQAKMYWLTFNIFAQGMLGLAADRFGLEELSGDIVNSLKDRAIYDEELGMYWKEYQIGYYWYEAPIETQAIMIELFDEVAQDTEIVEELKIWLLKQKQTTNWKTTKQTAEAIYALLLKGLNLLENDDLVNITLADQAIVYKDNPNAENPYEVKPEAGTGYFKTTWSADEVNGEMGNITVSKASKGVAWGAAYWQYFEDLDKITFAETNLKLNKGIYRVDLTESGELLTEFTNEEGLQIGDKVRIRIELRTDRNLEYVHLKDMRAAGLEPINVLSQYHYQDGLGYYQATKDVATHFFFDYIPKGTYVFEYDLRVQHKGIFSNGIATIQCMYAPEFTSHSNGVTIHVK